MKEQVCLVVRLANWAAQCPEFPRSPVMQRQAALEPLTNKDDHEQVIVHCACTSPAGWGGEMMLLGFQSTGQGRD